MTELSPSARAVLEAATKQACLAEWGTINDPPCHPDDEGWNGCYLCVKRDLIAAALRAAADQIVPYESTAPWNELKCDYDGDHWEMRQWVRAKILDIANELEAQ